jgi:hypothetical protein
MRFTVQYDPEQDKLFWKGKTVPDINENAKRIKFAARKWVEDGPIGRTLNVPLIGLKELVLGGPKAKPDMITFDFAEVTLTKAPIKLGKFAVDFPQFARPHMIHQDTLKLERVVDRLRQAPPLLAAPEPNSSTWRDGDHFIRALWKRGFAEIGTGAFSSVLVKGNSKRVIKVSRKPDVWLDYIVWATKEGFAGNLAPMVYSYRIIKGTKDTFYVAVMERLKSTISDLHFGNPAEKTAHALKDFIEEKRDSAGLNAERGAPGAIHFGVAFRSAFSKNLYDLHRGNFMVRHDNSVVLTDPIAGRDTGPSPSTPKRMRSRDLASLRAAQ